MKKRTGQLWVKPGHDEEVEAFPWLFEIRIHRRPGERRDP
jgi:hypothetical protein